MTHLHQYMKGFPGRCIPYTQVISFTKQILQGLAYLHDKKILHRDIKPQNLLIDNSNVIKLCDFGLSRSSSLPVYALSPDVVTIWYRAPELLKGNKQYTSKIDVWSVGCVVVELLSGNPLFPYSTENEILSSIDDIIVKNNYKKLKSIIGSCDKGMLDLILQMLDPNPETRISANDALQHRALA